MRALLANDRAPCKPGLRLRNTPILREHSDGDGKEM